MASVQSKTSKTGKKTNYVVMAAGGKRKWIKAWSRLEVQKLFDHKARKGKIPIAGGAYAIDQLKLCPKKGKVA